jgi:hypothetical protein
MTDLTIRTLEASTTGIPPGTVAALRGKLRGTVALPGEDGYDAARIIWNAMVDRRPGLVVRCLDTSDVINAVKLARDENLLLAVRSGGHNIAGNAVCDGGLLIDLSLMKSVRVDPASRTARVEPGATLADFDKEAQAFGLATPPWDQFDDRRCRPHARRWLRLDHPQVRADRRQSHLGRRRHG